MAGGVILGPDRFAIAFPALGDGVANEDDLRLTSALLDAFVQFQEPLIGLTIAGDWVDALLQLRGRVRLGENGGGQQDQGGGQLRAYGDESNHACTVGTLGMRFKPFQFGDRGARRWSAAIPLMSSRMSTTLSWP